MTLQSTGTCRDFVVANRGSVMLLLLPCFKCHDDKLQRQLRRFILALLRTFPAEDPPAQLRRVRLYPWLAACMSIRLSVSVNYDFDTAVRLHSTVANQQKRRVAPQRNPAPAGVRVCVNISGYLCLCGCQWVLVCGCQWVLVRVFS